MLKTICGNAQTFGGTLQPNLVWSWEPLWE